MTHTTASSLPPFPKGVTLSTPSHAKTDHRRADLSRVRVTCPGSGAFPQECDFSPARSSEFVSLFPLEAARREVSRRGIFGTLFQGTGSKREKMFGCSRAAGRCRLGWPLGSRPGPGPGLGCFASCLLPSSALLCVSVCLRVPFLSTRHFCLSLCIPSGQGQRSHVLTSYVPAEAFIDIVHPSTLCFLALFSG